MTGILPFLLWTSIPAVAAAAGSSLAAFWEPGEKCRSAIQHFAAGIVFSALCVEVMPDILHRHAPIAASIGFALGTLTMLGIDHLNKRRAEGGGKFSFAWVAGTDVLIDGLLIGAAFSTTPRTGAILAIALTFELLFVGVSLSLSLGGTNLRKGARAGIAALVIAALPLGAIIGKLALPTSRNSVTEAVLAFGSAAMLYLVTEELLTEAHEVKETPWITAVFFCGFLGMMLLEMIVP